MFAKGQTTGNEVKRNSFRPSCSQHARAVEMARPGSSWLLEPSSWDQHLLFHHAGPWLAGLHCLCLPGDRGENQEFCFLPCGKAYTGWIPVTTASALGQGSPRCLLRFWHCLAAPHFLSPGCQPFLPTPGLAHTSGDRLFPGPFLGDQESVQG